MHPWRRQTFIVAVCFAAVMAARIYVKKVLLPATPDAGEHAAKAEGDLSSMEPLTVGLDRPEGEAWGGTDRSSADGSDPGSPEGSLKGSLGTVDPQG